MGSIPWLESVEADSRRDRRSVCRFARALLRRSPILLLDEATSALERRNGAQSAAEYHEYHGATHLYRHNTPPDGIVHLSEGVPHPGAEGVQMQEEEIRQMMREFQKSIDGGF